MSSAAFAPRHISFWHAALEFETEPNAWTSVLFVPIWRRMEWNEAEALCNAPSIVYTERGSLPLPATCTVSLRTSLLPQDSAVALEAVAACPGDAFTTWVAGGEGLGARLRRTAWWTDFAGVGAGFAPG